MCFRTHLHRFQICRIARRFMQIRDNLNPIKVSACTKLATIALLEERERKDTGYPTS